MTQPGSPLRDIRAAELAAARSVANESQRAERLMAEARTEARQLIESARNRGRIQADEQYAQIVAKAEAEADEVSRHLNDDVAQLRARIAPRLDDLANAMLEIVVPRMGGSS